MGNDIQVRDRKVLYLDFDIKGQKFTLSKDEWFELKQKVDDIELYEKDPREERLQISGFSVNSNKQQKEQQNEFIPYRSLVDKPLTPHRRDDFLAHYYLTALSKRSLIPRGYTKQFEVKCDMLSGYKHTFNYYMDQHGNWGYKVDSPNGKLYPFGKLGAIENPDSVIGEFLEKIPFDKPFIKRNLLTLGSKGVTEGRRLKACVDILEHEGHLTKKQSMDDKRKTLYTRYRTNLGLRGDHKQEHSGVPLFPQSSTSSNGVVG